MEDFIQYYQQAKTKDLYIILGSQGSGTNLISNTLMAVFNFSVIRDQSIIFNSAVKIHKNNSKENIRRQFRYILNRFYPNIVRKTFQKHYHHRTRYYSGIEKYIDKIEIKTACDFACFFYAYHAFQNGKSFFAIKSDDIWENIEFLSQIFPNRKYIFNNRDPRDIVLSVIQKSFGPRQVYNGSLYVRKRVLKFLEEIERHQNISMGFKYEVLLANPLQIVQQFSQKFAMPLPQDRAERIKLLNIRSANFNKWKKLMSQRQLRVCESVLQNEILRCGYDLSGPATEVPAIESAFYSLADTIQRVPQKLSRIRQNIIRG